MPKKFKIIFVNIILLIFIWYFFSLCISAYALKHENQLSLKNLKIFYFGHVPNQIEDIDWMYSDPPAEEISDKNDILRKPAGTEYKKNPWLVMGCSFAYGQYLEDKQIFSYKLSKLIKHPVYNTGMCAAGFQHSYYLTTKDYFYEHVPPCDTVIYIVINDHFRRMLGENFLIADSYFYLHYNYKDNELILDDYNNPFLKFYKTECIIKAVCKLYNMYRLENKTDEITDEALVYFIKIRENLENRWHKKINFIVLFYDDILNPKYELLKKPMILKLHKNGFKTVEISELSNKKFWGEEYLEFHHPNEKAWDLITPLFVEECKKQGISI